MRYHSNHDRSGEVKIAWNFRALVRDSKDGRLLRVIKVKNLFLDCAVRKLRDMLGYPVFSTAGWTPAYGAVGTSNVAVDHEDLALGAEVFRKEITRREALDNGVIFYTSILADEANGYTLREFAIFTDPSGGEPWIRVVIPEIVKTVALVVDTESTWIETPV